MRPWSWRPAREQSGVIQPSSAGISPSPSEQPPKKSFNTGIKVLHDSENSLVDVVFVHGLTGDREETWQANGVSTSWPESLLPSKVANARVLTFGYDAYVADWRGMVSKNRIGNHSMNLLTTVATHREDDDTNSRPIIFVCHSLGGLVCEDALAMAQQRPEKHLKQILNCTRGIIFLGTPHHGSGLAHWAESLAKTIGLIKQTNSEILAVLRSESEILERVQGSFHTMIRSRAQDGLTPIEITCFYEELPLPGVGVVVPSHSAILPGYIPIGIRSNHIEMTKFKDVNDPGFVAVAGELRRWSKELLQTGRSPFPSAGSPAQIPRSQSPFGIGSQAPAANQTPGQEMGGGLYRGMQTAGLPKELLQHLPKATMGPKERNLLKAAGKGDVKQGMQLIQNGANIDAISEDGESALTRAIARRHINFVKLLLDNGATTDRSGPLVEKPLHVAVQTGNVKIVELILDAGADIDEMTASGSVLNMAIKGGREEITTLLLSRDADINQGKYIVHRSLMTAITNQNERLVKELLKRGAETDVMDDRLYHAVSRNLSESFRTFLESWKNGRYEEQVQIIRSFSSETEEKEEALNAALTSALKQRQPDIHAIFVELAEEFNLSRTKDYVYR